METKVTSSTAPGRSTAAKMKPMADGPFAEMIEKPPVKRTRVKKAGTATPKIRAVKKTSRTVILDPFAEVADAVSPVKKRAVKKASAESTATSPVSVPGAVATGAAKKRTRALKAKTTSKKMVSDVAAGIAATEPLAELSPAFKTLSEPELPALQRENRARLQMQSPGKLYFYWSVKENPYHLLRNAFGGETGSYTLVLKLRNLLRDTEVIQSAEAEGNWWFDVEPGGEYQAEIGFYAPNRPYFRIIYSNTVETPRHSPSPRAATDADWKVSAYKFAEVLDVAGFTQDAFDVAMAGDDYFAAEDTTHAAFARLVDSIDYDLGAIAAEDIRYAMIALASGVGLVDLRSRISPALFAILQANADKLGSGQAMNALTEFFDINETEFTEEPSSPAVYGASLINFPRTLKTRNVSARYSPLSSHSYR